MLNAPLDGFRGKDLANVGLVIIVDVLFNLCTDQQRFGPTTGPKYFQIRSSDRSYSRDSTHKLRLDVFIIDSVMSANLIANHHRPQRFPIVIC